MEVKGIKSEEKQKEEMEEKLGEELEEKLKEEDILSLLLTSTKLLISSFVLINIIFSNCIVIVTLFIIIFII
jgi:hypothetical protein